MPSSFASPASKTSSKLLSTTAHQLPTHITFPVLAFFHRIIRDHERQHDPPKGQQACTVSLSPVRHHHSRAHHNKSSLACLHPLSHSNNHHFCAADSSLHIPTAISPLQCRQSDPTKQSLTIPVPPKTLPSTRPPSPPAHNSLVSPASKKVCATDISPPSSPTNNLAQRTLPQYSLPTPPSSR